jgi:hypothetical protein
MQRVNGQRILSDRWPYHMLGQGEVTRRVGEAMPGQVSVKFSSVVCGLGNATSCDVGVMWCSAMQG